MYRDLLGVHTVGNAIQEATTSPDCILYLYPRFYTSYTTVTHASVEVLATHLKILKKKWYSSVVTSLEE